MKKILIPSAYMRSDLDDLDKVSYFYSRYIYKAGAIPIIAPSVIELASEYVSMCDAVILIGGVNDVSPSLYSQENTGSNDCNLTQDKFELAILEEALKQNKPILGICRGMQLINIYFGGSLIQDMPNTKLHLQYSKQEEFVHKVSVSDSRYFKDGLFDVNSVHHQVCDKVPSVFNITGRSEDGLIESFEHVKLPIVGVQWHPECIPSDSFSQDLIDWILSF